MRKTTNNYSLEARKRAVQLVLEAVGQRGSHWQALMSIAAEIGCTPQTLNTWVKKSEVAGDQRAGLPTLMAHKVKALERENRELRETNQVLREAASYYFALAQIDRPES